MLNYFALNILRIIGNDLDVEYRVLEVLVVVTAHIIYGLKFLSATQTM